MAQFQGANLPTPTREQLMAYLGVTPAEQPGTAVGPPAPAMMTPAPVMEAAANLPPPMPPRAMSTTASSTTRTSGPAPGSASLQDLMSQLNGRELESLKQQGLSVEALKKRLGETQSADLPVDLTGLAALTDAWTGSNFAGSYQPQETLKDRKAQIERLQGAIATGGNNLSENEISLLRSQLNNAFQMENLDYRKTQDKEQNALDRARIAKMGVGREGGKILPASAVNTYTDAQGAVGLASDLGGVIAANAKYMGPVSGGIFGKNPYDTERRELTGKFDLVRQKIGKMVEGGVLRKEDESKYAKILPSINDLPEVAASKAKEMEAMLKDDIGRYMENFGSAGYDVTGFAKQTQAYKSDAAKLKGDASSGADKPDVTQNGHTYKWNAKTGGYE
jgi:hypothetical protein